MNKSIHHSEIICNCLTAQNITKKLSEYALEYIISIIISIFCTGYRGKTVDFERHSNRHSTSISRFLKGEKWDENILKTTIKQNVIKTIYEESKHSGKPILLIIDDTIASKTKPSSKAKPDRISIFSLFTFEKKARLRTSGNWCFALM